MTNYTHDPSLGVRDDEIQYFNALDCSGERYVEHTPEEAQCSGLLSFQVLKTYFLPFDVK